MASQATGNSTRPPAPAGQPQDGGASYCGHLLQGWFGLELELDPPELEFNRARGNSVAVLGYMIPADVWVGARSRARYDHHIHRPHPYSLGLP